jgi:hypothetical protein
LDLGEHWFGSEVSGDDVRPTGCCENATGHSKREKRQRHRYVIEPLDFDLQSQGPETFDLVIETKKEVEPRLAERSPNGQL